MYTFWFLRNFALLFERPQRLQEKQWSLYFLLTFWRCRTPTEDLLLFLLTARLQLAYGAFSNMRLHPERLGLIRSFRLGLLEPAHSLRQVLLLELIPLLALLANGLAAPQVSVFVLLY